jgi:hypothetical protein
VIQSLWFLSVLFLLAPLPFAAAQPPNNITSELENKTVLLRGSYASDKLNFDAQGNLIGDASLAPFSLSGVAIEKVHLSDKKLLITGCRGLLIFADPANSSSAENIRLLPMGDERIAIAVARDPAHPESLEAAIHSIFAKTPQEALSSQPSELRQSSLDTVASLAPAAKAKSVGSAPSNGENPTPKPSAKVTPPRILRSVSLIRPNDFPPNSSCVITTVVDKSGFPTRIRVAHCFDPRKAMLGITAVGQYRFRPATADGNPVSVEIEIELVPHVIGGNIGR